MEREEVFQNLTEIFRNNFDDERICLSDSTSAQDIEDWDSLEQVNLVVAIQSEFKIRFQLDEVNAMRNVGEMVDGILSKVGE